MVFKEPKDKWAKTVVRSIVKVHSECDSCAAISGARMTSADREDVKRLCRAIGVIMSKY